VIPTYNRVERLGRVLRALAAQTVDAREFEVVVVSDGSTDATDAVIPVLQMPYKLLFVSQPNSGPAVARNTGVGRASGELILFLDDDVVPSPELIEQHLFCHAHSECSLVVIGPMLTSPGYRASPFVRWEQAMLYKQYDAMLRGDYAPTYRQFFTGNASLSRRLILDTGGFDSRYRRAEDIELAYRLAEEGTHFLFNEKAIGYHFAERSFRSWIEIARSYGRNDVIFDRETVPESRLQQARLEFKRRNVCTRALTRACVGREWLEQSLQWPFRGIVAFSEILRWEHLSKVALSGLYNATYYCGMADELGGADRFWRFVKEGRASVRD
jgi:glycosyltransferase involved in cell wall biosynthesis